MTDIHGQCDVPWKDTMGATGGQGCLRFNAPSLDRPLLCRFPTIAACAESLDIVVACCLCLLEAVVSPLLRNVEVVTVENGSVLVMSISGQFRLSNLKSGLTDVRFGLPVVSDR